MRMSKQGKERRVGVAGLIATLAIYRVFIAIDGRISEKYYFKFKCTENANRVYNDYVSSYILCEWLMCQTSRIFFYGVRVSSAFIY